MNNTVLQAAEVRRDANAYIKANRFLELLKKHVYEITPQEFRTLRGQALSGDLEGANKGLWKILGRTDRPRR